MKIRKTNVPVLYPEHRGSVTSIRYPAFAEIKRDGEYCVAYVNEGKNSYLINKYGTQRYDSRITYQLGEYMRQSKGLVESAVLLGELCYMDGLKGDLYKLISNKTNDLCLKYYIFDICMLNGSSLASESLLTRREMLSESFGALKSPIIKINQAKLVQQPADLDLYRHYAKSNGFEGVVVKNLDSQLVFGPCGWVKIKDKDINVYPIVSIDPVKERIGVMVTWLDDEGKECVKEVGCKAVHAVKKTLAIGDEVEIEHQGILSLGGLRHPVFVKKVVNEHPEWGKVRVEAMSRNGTLGRNQHNQGGT